MPQIAVMLPPSEAGRDPELTIVSSESGRLNDHDERRNRVRSIVRLGLQLLDDSYKGRSLIAGSPFRTAK